MDLFSDLNEKINKLKTTNEKIKGVVEDKLYDLSKSNQKVTAGGDVIENKNDSILQVNIAAIAGFALSLKRSMQSLSLSFNNWQANLNSLISNKLIDGSFISSANQATSKINNLFARTTDYADKLTPGIIRSTEKVADVDKNYVALDDNFNVVQAGSGNGKVIISNYDNLTPEQKKAVDKARQDAANIQGTKTGNTDNVVVSSYDNLTPEQKKAVDKAYQDAANREAVRVSNSRSVATDSSTSSVNIKQDIAPSTGLTEEQQAKVNEAIKNAHQNKTSSSTNNGAVVSSYKDLTPAQQAKIDAAIDKANQSGIKYSNSSKTGSKSTSSSSNLSFSNLINSLFKGNSQSKAISSNGVSDALRQATNYSAYKEQSSRFNPNNYYNYSSTKSSSTSYRR